MTRRKREFERIALQVDRTLNDEPDMDLAQRVADLRGKKSTQLRAILERAGAETNTGLAAGYLLYMNSQNE